MSWSTPFRTAAAHAVAVALVCVVVAPGQDAFPLRAIEFEGNRGFSAEDLAAVTGLKIGEPVRKKDFDLALRRLNETGVFESLRYRFEPLEGGYRLTVIVQEVPELFPVRFNGFDADPAQLVALLKERLPIFVGVAPGGGPMVRMVVNALQGWWKEQGGEEEVVANILPAGDGKFELVVGPEKQTSNIAFARFENTGHVEALELQRIFNHSVRGEPYSESRLNELLHYNARPLYTELGYMNVKFCPCTAHPDPDSEGLLVEVHVEQGEVYLWGDINWPDPMPIDEETLDKVSLIGSGHVANMKAAYDTMARIGEGLKRHGYMKAHATFDERVDHEDRRVHLDVHISTGTQYRFSRLLIEGLDILSAPAVRKRWGMQAGDVFDVRYPAYFLDRVKADAMFENLKRTSWSIDVDEARGLVDVTLVFSGLLEESGL
ncbi:MAG: hypothetical protein OXN97_11420 [Bryobacterales bacterium]|nr:hypothetical protein [Bryobacterales bacterium]